MKKWKMKKTKKNLKTYLSISMISKSLQKEFNHQHKEKVFQLYLTLLGRMQVRWMLLELNYIYQQQSLFSIQKLLKELVLAHLLEYYYMDHQVVVKHWLLKQFQTSPKQTSFQLRGLSCSINMQVNRKKLFANFSKEPVHQHLVLFSLMSQIRYAQEEDLRITPLLSVQLISS